MQIVIDIPETMIQELKDGCFGVKHNVYELAGCIMNGTPLPPHGRLIDADKLKGRSDVVNTAYGGYVEVVRVDDLDYAPTILEATKTN